MKSDKTEVWNQRFAGLIDGDGYFYINKKNEISFEITTNIEEARMLYDIKNKLNSGSVKLKSGNNGIRYRVKKINTIKEISHRIQGKLLNPVRLKQLKKVCELLNVEFINPENKLNPNSAYLSGLFDSDGTIKISVSKTSLLNSQKSGISGKIARLSESKGYHQLIIKITSVHKDYLFLLQKVYGFGKIDSEKINLKNKSLNIKYNWLIQSDDDCVLFYEYLKKNPLRSIKMHRIRLINKYFFYKKCKYHLKFDQSIEYKIWLKFCKSWFKYSN